MKIQLVMNFALPLPAVLGGAVEKRWHALAEELSRRHEVVIYARQYADQPAQQTIGNLRFVRLPGFDWSNLRALNALKSSVWALRVAKRLEPGDVLIMNDVMAPILLPRLRRNLGLLCLEVARMPKFHYRFCYGRVDRFYCVSSAVLEDIQRVAPRRAQRAKLLFNQTDLDRFSPPDERVAAPRCEILYAGRIHPEKGLDVLVRALALARQRAGLFLRLVGPAEESSGGDAKFAARLRALAAEAGLSPDEWTLDPPVFNEASLAKVYRAADIFAYPSRARFGETFGISVLEAMACGRPSIVSGLSCFRDLVTNDDNGLVVDSYEPAAWANAFDRLATDRPLRERLGRRARQRALEFSVEKIARVLEEDLAGLVAKS